MFIIPRFDRKRFSMPANFAYRGGLLLVVSAACALQSAEAQSPARLRPDGIIGTIFLSNADSAPDEVAENFVEAAGGEDANLVILVGGRKRPTTGEEREFLARWQKLEPADVQVVGIGDLDQPGDRASAAKLREASGVWLTGIDAATMAAAARRTKLRGQLQALLDHR